MNHEQPTPPDMKIPANYMAVLRLYEAAASYVLPQHFSPDCGVNATRVAMAVLQTMGIDLIPTPVDVMVTNAVYDQLVVSGEEPSDEWFEKGAYSVGIDTETTVEGSWAGHLVGVYEEVILDSATGQFRRPEKNIMLDDVTLLLFERQEWPVHASNSSGTVLHYKPLENPLSDFRELPGFQASKSNMLVADNIVKLMRILKNEIDREQTALRKAEEKRERKRASRLKVVKP